MKRYIRSDTFNYDRFVLTYERDGWYVYENGSVVAGPFDSWIEAEDYIDAELAY